MCFRPISCVIPIQCASEHSRAASPGMPMGVSAVSLSSVHVGKPGIGVSIGASGQLWSVDSVQHDGGVKAAGSFVKLLSSSTWKIEIQQLCFKFQG